MPDTTPTNFKVLDYTNRDYTAIRAWLVGLAKGLMPSWQTAGEEGDFGTLLLEMFAFCGDVMNYYIDRLASEAFLGTAVRRQSVLFIADMLGYTPIGTRGAWTTLSFNWSWDSDATDIDSILYDVASYAVKDGVAILQLLAPVGRSVDISAGQTIEVSLQEAGYEALDGLFRVRTVTSTTSPNGAVITFLTTASDADVTPTGTRTIEDGVLVNGDATLTSATATFSSTDVGSLLIGDGIPTGTTIASITNGTTVEMSNDATDDIDPATIEIIRAERSTVKVGTAIIIPQGTKIASSPDDKGNTIVFETAAELVLNSAEAVAPVDGSPIRSITRTTAAQEGTTVSPTTIATSKGVPNAEFVLPDKGVLQGSLTVYTQEGGHAVQWSHIDRLSFAGPTQSAFATYVDDAGLTHIVFGDGTSGRIPPVNALINVGYRFGVGAAANSLGINSLVNILDDHVSQSGVTVTNTTVPQGGADEETVESMRFSIPRAARLRQRAITNEDYTGLALQVGGVTKAITYGESYASTYIRIASTAQSRDYQIDNVLASYAQNGVVTLITDGETSTVDLTEGKKVYVKDVVETTDGLNNVEETLDRVYGAGEPIKITKLDYDSGTGLATITTERPHGFLSGQPFAIVGLVSANASDFLNEGYGIVNSILTPVDEGDPVAFTYVCNGAGDISDEVPTAGTVVAKMGLQFTDSNVTVDLDTPMVEDSSPQATVKYVEPTVERLIAAVEAYIDDKKPVGAVVYAEPPVWTDVTINITVFVLPLYSREAVRAAVQAAVENVFAYENVDFGQRISIGKVYRAALAVDGVDYILLNSLYDNDSTAGEVVDPIDFDDNASTVYVVGGPPNIAHIETTDPHGFTVGQKVTISGATPSWLNGTFTIIDTPSATEFVFKHPLRGTTGSSGSPVTIDAGRATVFQPVVQDIETPTYNLPRLDPLLAEPWVTAKGGLVNT